MAFVTGVGRRARVRAAQDRHRRRRVHATRAAAAASTSTRATAAARRRRTPAQHARPRTSSGAARRRSTQYDMVFFPCQGGAVRPDARRQQNVVNYANAGGRVFATHYSYVWLYNNAPVRQHGAAGTSTRRANFADDPGRGYIDTTLPQGPARSRSGSRSSAPRPRSGRSRINTLRHDFDGVDRALAALDQRRRPEPRHTCRCTTPSTRRSARRRRSSAAACSSTTSTSRTRTTAAARPSPHECAGGADDAAGEAARVHDLRPRLVRHARRRRPARRKTCAAAGRPRAARPATAAAASSSAAPARRARPAAAAAPACGAGCTPKTCAQQGINCGPPGDGCGGILECGTCPPADLRRRRHAGRVRHRHLHAEDLRAAGHRRAARRRRLRQPAQLRHLPRRARPAAAAACPAVRRRPARPKTCAAARRQLRPGRRRLRQRPQLRHLHRPRRPAAAAASANVCSL